MERKLELKDICGYLPNGLWCYYDTEDMSIQELGGFSPEYWLDKFGYEIECIDDEIKPILRPLSDLNKPIIHNGKEEVPIVELIKIAGLVKEMETESFRFGYCAVMKGFYYHSYTMDKGCYSCFDISNQYLLFDYLHSRFIDYRGLIDAGLAVSVYDLENNPYK